MLLTGDPVSAQRLADLGVVNRVVEPGMAVAEAIALAERIELNAPTSIRATLTALDAIAEDDDAVALGRHEGAEHDPHERRSRGRPRSRSSSADPPEWPGR